MPTSTPETEATLPKSIAPPRLESQEPTLDPIAPAPSAAQVTLPGLEALPTPDASETENSADLSLEVPS